MAIFDHTHPKIRVPRVPRDNWPHPFITMPNQKNFNKLLIFESLYKYAKNEAVLSINSGEIVDLKILESDWLRAIGLYLRKKIFPKYGICVGT